MRSLTRIVSPTIFAVILLALGTVSSHGVGQTRVSTATGGAWLSGSTWIGGAVPGKFDYAVITPGATVTVTEDQEVISVTFTNSGPSSAVLAVDPGVTLTVTAGITNQSSATTNTSAVLQGGGAITCVSMGVGGTATPTPANSALFATMTSTVSNLSISGTLAIRALYNSGPAAASQGVFALGSGSVSVGGNVAFATVPIFGPILTLATGSQNGTLTISGSPSFTITGGGSSTFTPNGTSATVIYAGANQAVNAATYQNLTLAGSGVKTNAGITVNGTLSLQGTAKTTAAPTYGVNAVLEYKGSAAQTNGLELRTNMVNLTINNANGVRLTNSPTVSNTLTLANGKLITGANQINLAANATISGGGATNYVNGKLQKTLNIGTQTFTFPIGDASAYAPLTVSSLSVTASGSIRASTTNGNHPQIATSGIASTSGVNRYWTLTQSGGTFGTYDATFNYPATDVDAGAVAAGFAASQWSGSAWSISSVSGIPTTTSTTITGESGFGDFVIGDPVPLDLVWSGGGGADMNWSAGSNWLSGETPRAVDDVFFYDNGAVATASNINNIVDASFAGAVGSVNYANTNNFHTTLINPGVTLTVNSNFIVGTETFVTATQTVVATITGNGGTLALDLPSTVSLTVRQGVPSSYALPGTPRATLDLSGLGTFTADARGMSVGVESGSIRRAGGALYLARTNLISGRGVPSAGVTYGGSPSFYIGHNAQGGNQNSLGSVILMGITNAFFGDYIVIARGNQTNCLLAFNPAFLANNPVAYFRSIDGVGRVGVWLIGDNSPSGNFSSPSAGTNDFTGGRVDALVDLMFVGRGALNNHGTANSPGIGTLTFNNGTIDVDTLYVGYQNLGANYSSSGIGTVNVNSTNATLVVNSLEFGRATDTSLVTPSGRLNISDGKVIANTILVGGGTGTIAMTNGTLMVTNTAGTPAAPLTSLTLTTSTLQYSIAGATTNSVVTALTTGGTTNHISIASLPALTSYPTQFTLLKYSGSIGGAGFNFGLASLPPANPGHQGYVSNNTAKSAVVLVLTQPPAKLAVTSVNGGSAPVAGTPFNVVVQSQDNGGTPRNVTVDTAVSLSLNAGGGTLGGTLTGTIPAGTNTTTVIGVTYTKAEDGVVLTASRTSGENLTAGNSSPFSVNPGAVSATQSTVVPSPASVAADGVSSSTVTVALKDAHNNPVSGKTVTLAKDGGSSTISAASGPSDANGVVTFSVRDLVVESTVYTATNTTDGLTIAQTAAVTFTSVPWHNAAWSYRKAIGIDHTKVAGNLTNFPVLIHFTDSDLPGRALPNGFDILFTSADGTNKLAHQIEQYTSSNGALIAWVNVSNLSSTVDTILYLYYGNPASGNQQNADAAWDSNFKAVWHLEEAGSGAAGEYKDSTSNTNNAQGGGGTPGAVPVPMPGKIGNAQNCDGTADYIVSGNQIGISGGAVRTISFWVNLNNTNRMGLVGWGSNAPKAEFEAAVRNGQLFLWGYGSGNDWSNIGTPQTNSWQYHSVTYDGSVARWYVNGSPVSGGFTNTYATTNSPAFIGFENNNGLLSYLAGTIDEVRIAGTARSAHWITTEYQNQNSPAAFHTVGTQQGLPATRLVITSVNGGVPFSFNTAFYVTVQAQDVNGFSVDVVSNTAVSLSLNSGSGTLGGTLAGTITAGTDSVTISEVTYSKAESGVVLTATRTGGDDLVAGNSSAFTINPADQTIAFPSPDNQTYGVAPVTLTAAASSELPVSYSILSGPASVSSNLLTITGAGSITIQASQSGNTDWNAAPSTNQTISVAPKTVTGSITISDKVYDGTIAASIATRLLSGVINEDAASLSGGAANFPDKTVGAGKTAIAINLSLTGAQAGNYVLASDSATNTASITAKGLTVSAQGVDKVYDTATNATVTLSDDRIAGDVLTAGYTVASFADKNVGNGKTVNVSGISLSGTDSGNYTANPTASTTANITAAPLVVSADDQSRPYGTANPVLTAGYSGFVGGEDTNVLSGSPALSTTAVQNSPVGTYPIQISQDTLSAANYSFNFTNGTLTVIELPPVLTISLVGDQAVLHAAGVTPGNTYHVLASTDLFQWTEIGTVQAEPDGTISFNDNVVLQARFYRVSVNVGP